MKYRTKLYLTFTLFVLVVAIPSLGVLYWKFYDLLFQELRSKALTVAITAAGSINGDLLAQINSKADMKTPAFQTIKQQILKIRNENRRKDIYVVYVYTMRLNPKNPDELDLEIGISTPDSNEVVFWPVSYPEGIRLNGFVPHLKENWVFPRLTTDRWGTFLTALAPIYDSKGNYVRTLGIDFSAAYVNEEMSKITLFALLTIVITLLLGIIAAWLLSRFVTQSLDQISQGVAKIGHGDLKTHIKIKTQDEFGELAETINLMAKELEAHERLKQNFVRYVSKHVLEKILTSETMPSLKGERRKITVLFSDIRQFTRLSEKLPPETVVSQLNEYLDVMLNVIFDNNGTLDKFMGDGLLVEFGAPLEDEQQEMHAIKTAIDMQFALEILNQKWKQEARPELAMGVGIHTGPAIVGNIGSEKRMEYTAIGDTVNVAFRLEKETKDPQMPILISETTFKAVQGQFNAEEIGPIQLSGRDQPIIAYVIRWDTERAKHLPN